MHWHPEGPSPIPDSDKAAVRDNLLEGLMRAPPLVRTQLGESLKAVAGKDFPEHWPGLLPAILQNLSSQVRLRAHALSPSQQQAHHSILISNLLWGVCSTVLQVLMHVSMQAPSGVALTFTCARQRDCLCM